MLARFPSERFSFVANFYLLVEFGITHSLCWQEFFLQFLDFWIYFGDVPRYRFFVIFRGTKSIIPCLTVQRIVYDHGLNTPIYEFLWFPGYKINNSLSHGVTYCIWLWSKYPNIWISLIFGVRFLDFLFLSRNILYMKSMNVPRYFKYCLFWGTHVQIIAHFIQHIVCVYEKRTPTFQFFLFLRYGHLFALFIHRLTPQQL